MAQYSNVSTGSVEQLPISVLNDLHDFNEYEIQDKDNHGIEDLSSVIGDEFVNTVMLINIS